MNSFAFATIFALFVAYASATFDAATGVFSLGAVALNGGNSLALTLGSSTAFLTSAGIVAGGLGLLALGLVKAALLAGEEGLRSKRSAPVEQLAAIDNYFATIADMDVDDCGKLLVCQLESIPREERTPEEGIIAGLFGESSTIDPAPLRPNTTWLPTWDKLPNPRLPAHADTPGVPWTARPFHKLWLRWPVSHLNNLLRPKDLLVI